VRDKSSRDSQQNKTYGGACSTTTTLGASLACKTQAMVTTSSQHPVDSLLIFSTRGMETTSMCNGRMQLQDLQTPHNTIHNKQHSLCAIARGAVQYGSSRNGSSRK
jgi:hypothetical protein